MMGLNSDDWDLQLELTIKANGMQLVKMIEICELELKQRRARQNARRKEERINQ